MGDYCYKPTGAAQVPPRVPPRSTYQSTKRARANICGSLNLPLKVIIGLLPWTALYPHKFFDALQTSEVFMGNILYGYHPRKPLYHR